MEKHTAEHNAAVPRGTASPVHGGLALTDATVGYGLPLVAGVSLAVAQGEIACIVGANGCGKSTILRTIAGIVPALAGEICIGGVRVDTWPAFRRAAEAGLAYVPQSVRNFQGLSVTENLHLAFWNKNDGWRARSRAIDGLLSRSLFEPLRRRAGERAGRLSGGEDLLLAVGRAILRQPAVVLFDEPSAGLFLKYRELVVALIREVSLRAAVVVVEQMLPVVDALPGRVYLVHQSSAGGAWEELDRVDVHDIAESRAGSGNCAGIADPSSLLRRHPRAKP